MRLVLGDGFWGYIMVLGEVWRGIVFRLRVELFFLSGRVVV